MPKKEATKRRRVAGGGGGKKVDVDGVAEGVAVTETGEGKGDPPGNESSSEEEEEDAYEVEKIVDHHWDLVHPEVTTYLVKWKGYPESENTWEPLENLSGAPDVLRKYKEKINMVEKQNMFPEIQKQVAETGHTLVSAISTGKDGDDVKLHVKMNLEKARETMTKELGEWEKKIQEVCQQAGEAPITVENTADLQSYPKDFTWITQSQECGDVKISRDPAMYCSCEAKDCGKDRCCPKANESDCAYNQFGRLRVIKSTPIYECNKSCPCDDTCPTKVVQKGRQVPLCIFRTKSKGWGVKAVDLIPKGTFVAEYVGEVVRDDEAERRGKLYDAEGATYLFDLDFSDQAEPPYAIDAKYKGNVSHFINHSCNPNLQIRAVWINCLDPDLPQLAMFARRDIKAGEELSFNYRMNNSEEGDASTPEDTERSVGTPRGGVKRKIDCNCGSKACKKYL